MRTLSVCALKGGTGKTVTAHSLAACYAEGGRRVLVVDLDPQGSLSIWYGLDREGVTVGDVLRGGDLVDAVQPTNVEGVDAVAADPRAELVTGREVDARLRAAVLALRKRWDVLVIDTPPGVSTLTLAAISAAPEVLAVVNPEGLSLHALAELRDTVDAVAAHGVEGGARLSHVLPCNVPRTRHARDVLDLLAERFPDTLRPVIRSSARVPAAFAFGVSILDHDPDGRPATDYREAAAAILDQRPPRRKANR